MLKNNICKTLLYIVICLSLFACSAKTDFHDLPIGGEIADLSDFPQDLVFYANNLANNELLSEEEQKAHFQRTKELFFRPWNIKFNTEKARVNKKYVFLDSKKSAYAENLLPWTKEDNARLYDNANEEEYPSLLQEGFAQKAITVRDTPLRTAPTLKPKFNNPKIAGEGYPFDTLQVYTMPLASPVLITHKSKDGAWAYIETALLSGWVQSQDLATISDKAAKYYEKQELMAITSQDTAIYLKENFEFITKSNIGTLLVLDNSGFGLIQAVCIPIRNVNGEVEFVKAVVEDDAIQAMPIQFTAQNIATLGNSLINSKYGWGELNNNHDCSAMLRDLFLSFGIWLERNSKAQAKALDYIDLSKYSASERVKIIKEKALPFKSLILFKGHISLYLGEYKSKIAMFHNMWGVRTEVDGREGRYVVGKAVVSSLYPGIELEHAKYKEGLTRIIEGIGTIR